MIDFENVVNAMLFESRVAMLDGEMLEVEPCQFSDCMTHVMEKLRKAEKDAARYRKLKRMAESNGTVGFMLATLTVNQWDSEIDMAIKVNNGGE